MPAQWLEKGYENAQYRAHKLSAGNVKTNHSGAQPDNEYDGF